MKPIYILALLIFVGLYAGARTKRDTSHTAFNDVLTIKRILSKGGNTPDSLSCDTVRKIVLSYIKGSQPLDPYLGQTFNAKIADMIRRSLANVNVAAKGDFILGIKNELKKGTVHDNFAKQLDSLKNYYYIIRKEAETKLENLTNSKVFVDPRNKFDLYSKSLKSIDSLNSIDSSLSIVTTPDSISDLNKQRIVQNKKLIESKLKDIQIDSLKQLKVSLNYYTLYKESYDKLEEVKKPILETEKEINEIFAKIPGKILKGYYSNFRDTELSFNAGSIQSNIGEIPEINIFKSSTAPETVSSSNNIETKAIDALAILLVRQVKKDLLLNFLIKLRAEAAKQPLVLDMFPNTFALLGEYRIYEIPSFGPVWSHAIAEDLISIPEHIAEGNYLNSRPDIKNNQFFLVFRDIIAIAKQVSYKTTIPGMVTYFCANPGEINNKYLFGAFQALNMIDQELVVLKDGKASWITADNLNNFNADDLKLLLGLLSSKYVDVFKTFKTSFVFSGKPEDHIEKRKYLVNILSILNASLIADRGKIANGDTVYKSNSFWKMQRRLFENLVNENIIACNSEDYKKTIKLINNCLNIYDDIEEKNYSAMVHESLEVIGQIIPERNFYTGLLIKTWKLNGEGNRESFNDISKYLDKIDIILAKKAEKRDTITIDTARLNKLADTIYSQKLGKNLLVYSDAKKFKTEIISLYMRAVPISSANAQPHNTFMYSLARLGEFLTEVEKAKDSKGLSDILAAYTIQPNSYLIKRNTRASISIQSYVGTYFGNEFAPASKPVFGLSAPIGISFNWGFHKKTRQITDATFIGRDGKEKTLSGSSFSINLSIIDIGAVVSYRINNGEDGPLPKNVTFGQFLSPGLSFSYGIKNIPLSLTLGTQFTPQLRSLSNEAQQHSAIRVYGGLFYDLPFQSFSQR